MITPYLRGLSPLPPQRLPGPPPNRPSRIATPRRCRWAMAAMCRFVDSTTRQQHWRCVWRRRLDRTGPERGRAQRCRRCRCSSRPSDPTAPGIPGAAHLIPGHIAVFDGPEELGDTEYRASGPWSRLGGSGRRGHRVTRPARHTLSSAHLLSAVLPLCGTPNGHGIFLLCETAMNTTDYVGLGSLQLGAQCLGDPGPDSRYGCVHIVWNSRRGDRRLMEGNGK